MKKLFFLILLIAPSVYCWGQQVAKIYPAVDSAQVDMWGFLLCDVPIQDTTGNIGDGYGLTFDQSLDTLVWTEFWATPVSDPTDNYLLKIDTDPDPDTLYWAADDTVIVYRAAIHDTLLAITTSANWADRVSDETGTGLWVFGTSPTFTTDITSPLVIGGTATTSDLSLKTTSGVGEAGADMHFLVGNNGAIEAMTVLNSGNVGMGTATPVAPLEIVGAKPGGNIGGFQSGMLHVRGDGDTEFSNVVITGHNSYNGNTQLWYLGSTSSGNDNIALINRQYGDIHFYTDNAFRVVIDTVGNVGIGTNAPAADLHIKSTDCKVKLHATETAANASLVFPAYAYDNVEGAGIIFDRGPWGTGKLYFSMNIEQAWNDYTLTSSDAVMTLTSTDSVRRVGIGTTSPNEHLEVSGTGDQYIQVNSTDGATPGIKLIDTGSENYDWRARVAMDILYFGYSVDDGSSWYSSLYFGGLQSSPQIRTFSSGADLNLGAGDDIVFQTYSTGWDERMRITAAGDVGIGTLSPPERISVVGNIATGDTTTGDVDVYHYFSTDGSWTTEYLMFDDGEGRFKLSSDLKGKGNIYVNYDGPGENAHIYFTDAGEADKSISWNTTNNTFDLNAPIKITDGDMNVDGWLALNYTFEDKDATIYFKKPTSGLETLIWDKTDTRFEFSDDLYVNGTVSSANTLVRSFVLQAIDSDHDIKLWKTPVAITIDSIFGQCDGGTNVIGALDEYDWDNSDLVAVVNADWTFTTTYQAIGSFTNAGIAAKNHLKWHTTSVSGTVNFFDLTIWYHED